jgi:hypothetical protein
MKRYCRRGHDTEVCGRLKNRGCRACKTQDDAARYQRQAGGPTLRRARLRAGIVGLPDQAPGPGHPCDCCHRKIRGTPHADHDHATGQFRGWVCPRCNTGLGYVEQPDWLAQARDYLRATR